MALPRRANPRPFDLTSTLREALADLAQGTEETDAGLAASPLLDSASGEGADYDDSALDRLERYVDRALTYENLFDDLKSHPVIARWRERLQRARRSLTLLRQQDQHQHAAILMVAYGHADPFVRQYPELAALPPALASLIRYTDATEEQRLVLVRLEAIERSTDKDGAIDLARYQRAHHDADRFLTSADAVRSILLDHEEPIHARANEHPRQLAARREARRLRHATHVDRRACYLSQAHGQAASLLREAEKAFRIAWMSSAPR